jgi:hypothetical protein
MVLLVAPNEDTSVLEIGKRYGEGKGKVRGRYGKGKRTQGHIKHRDTGTFPREGICQRIMCVGNMGRI